MDTHTVQAAVAGSTAWVGMVEGTVAHRTPSGWISSAIGCCSGFDDREPNTS